MLGLASVTGYNDNNDNDLGIANTWVAAELLALPVTGFNNFDLRSDLGRS